MDQRTQIIFTEHRAHLLAETARAWGFDENSAVELDGFENHLCEVRRGDRPFVLRLCHSLHRTPDQVCAELDWVAYLDGCGIPVAAPVRTTDGAFHRTIELEASYFVASLCEKAPGRPPRRSDYSPSFFQTWGALAGMIHHATRLYRPPEPPRRRYHWHEDPTHNFEQYRPVADEEVLVRFADTVACLKNEAIDPDSYGLAHNDLHPGNFFIDGDRLTAFDFDDCHYQFLVNDIAMALFYALPMPASSKETDPFAEEFLRSFLLGYRQHATLASETLRLVPTLMKLREIDLYCQILLHLGSDIDGWAGAYLQGRRERIIAHQPVVTLDFTRF